MKQQHSIVFALSFLLVLSFGGPSRPSAQTADDARPAQRERREVQVPAAESPRITRTKERYDFAHWPAAGPGRDGVSVKDLAYPGYEGAGFELLPGAPLRQAFAGMDGNPWFRLEVTVHDTAAEAREGLVELLTYVSSPNLVPTATRSGVRAGEIGFVGFAPAERISWIAFARGNVAVRLCNLDPSVTPQPDLRRLAEATDAWIQKRPPLEPGVLPHRPKIVRLRAERDACTAGEALVLHLEAGEVVGCHWAVGGSGQGVVERDAKGRWVLHTTGEGTIELTCHVLAPNGLTASQTIAIAVADDD